MVTFRVTAEKPILRAHERNPFLVKEIWNLPPRRVISRTWEFEARSEEQVRELFEEAQRMGVANVRGFRLAKIERLEERAA